jgi:hypothetical protein
MKLMKDLVGIDRRYFSDNLYGVEIEVEGIRLPGPDDMTELWRIERDSSLKTPEAWEYVLRAPLMLPGVEKAINQLKKLFEIRKGVIHDSVRAGVHIHMNVQSWNIVQLMTFATCYYTIEDLLMKWCGPNREGNLFALRTKDAEYVLFRLIEALEQRNLKSLKTDNIRYASLNYCSLFKYGTIEFRGMRTSSNLDDVLLWNKIIDELRTSSLNFSNPVEVLDMMSGDGEEQLLQTLLPTYHELFKSEGFEESVRNSARRVQLLVYGTDWAEFSKQPINIFKTGTGGL